MTPALANAKKQVAHLVINEVERRLMKMTDARPRDYGEQLDQFPVTHRFTPGLYCREIFMPAGSVVTSYIHRYEHPYVVSAGDCLVFTDECRWQRIVAPYFGITKPGTRRLLAIAKDTVWTTFHTTNTTGVEEVEREIFIAPYPAKEAA
jgi:hypothetical protein